MSLFSEINSARALSGKTLQTKAGGERAVLDAQDAGCGHRPGHAAARLREQGNGQSTEISRKGDLFFRDDHYRGDLTDETLI